MLPGFCTAYCVLQMRPTRAAPPVRQICLGPQFYVKSAALHGRLSVPACLRLSPQLSHLTARRQSVTSFFPARLEPKDGWLRITDGR